MLTVLTAYFWFFAVGNIILWIYHLFTTPKIKATAINSGSVGEQFAAMGCMSVMAVPLLAVLAGPLAYLQAAGLTALGFPSWLAWLSFALAVVTLISTVSKPVSVSGMISSLPLFGYLLAWYGLQALAALP